MNRVISDLHRLTQSVSITRCRFSNTRTLLVTMMHRVIMFSTLPLPRVCKALFRFRCLKKSPPSIQACLQPGPTCTASLVGLWSACSFGTEKQKHLSRFPWSTCQCSSHGVDELIRVHRPRRRSRSPSLMLRLIDNDGPSSAPAALDGPLSADRAGCEGAADGIPCRP